MAWLQTPGPRGIEELRTKSCTSRRRKDKPPEDGSLHPMLRTSTYSGSYSLGTSDGGTSILEDYVQPSRLEESNNSEVQTTKKAVPQEASENFDGEEIGTKRT